MRVMSLSFAIFLLSCGSVAAMHAIWSDPTDSLLSGASGETDTLLTPWCQER